MERWIAGDATLLILNFSNDGSVAMEASRGAGVDVHRFQSISSQGHWISGKFCSLGRMVLSLRFGA